MYSVAGWAAFASPEVSAWIRKSPGAGRTLTRVGRTLPTTPALPAVPTLEISRANESEREVRYCRKIAKERCDIYKLYGFEKVIQCLLYQTAKGWPWGPKGKLENANLLKIMLDF